MAEIFYFMDKLPTDDNKDKPYALDHYKIFADAAKKLAYQLSYIPGAKDAVEEYSIALGQLIAKTTAPGIEGNLYYCQKHTEKKQ